METRSLLRLGDDGHSNAGLIGAGVRLVGPAPAIQRIRWASRKTQEPFLLVLRLLLFARHKLHHDLPRTVRPFAGGLLLHLVSHFSYSSTTWD